MLKRNYYAKRKKVQELFDKALLMPGDFNVRVTVVDKENVNSEGSWREIFRDAIGGGIINDSVNYYHTEIMTESYNSIQSTCIGTKIIENNFDYIKNEDVVRINLTKLPKEKNNLKSWIIIRV
jgi:hypothetical protein